MSASVGSNFFYFLDFMCMCVLPASKFVHHMHAVPVEVRRGGNESPGTGIVGSPEPLCGWSKLILGLLGEQSVFLHH